MLVYGTLVPTLTAGWLPGAAWFTACTNGMLGIVEDMLRAGADIDQQDDSARAMTALIFASFAGNEDLVALLLRCKANVEAPTAEGTTALMLAAFNRQV